MYNNGLNDLFEYGLEFVAGGNALGDGSSRKNTSDDGNSTKKEPEESFQQKYRKQMKMDLDDILNEDDDDKLEDEDPSKEGLEN